VDKRRDATRYETVKTIEQFGRKILAAAGVSSNFELVTKLQKLGGNGPIMASAMSSLGMAVTYIGTVGYPKVHPVFEEFAAGATVHSVAEPGYTDALEFSDGKLMLGKYTSIYEVDWGLLEKTIGGQKLREVIARSRLIGMVNWTMMLGQPDIWRNILRILGEQTGSVERKQIFIDLADPEKRTKADLLGAMGDIAKFQAYADVILGLNLKESTQVAGVLGVEVVGDAESAIEETAAGIRNKLGVFTVVIHPRKGAAAARMKDGHVEAGTFRGPFVAEPRLSTGAGDNFNAGFCVASVAGLPIEQCLCVGTATSGYYVRNAASPTMEQLIGFCENLPLPE
jgi:sugar/nucleoside kinase (ribokinase family)